MDKFDAVRKAGTSAPNFDLDTEAIIERLRAWDARYGIEVLEAKSDLLGLRFLTLPDDAMPLAKEIYEFCPDTVDQGFGVYDDETVAALTQGDDGQTAKLRELLAGIDFRDPNFGVELLRRFVVSTKMVGLWWD